MNEIDVSTYRLANSRPDGTANRGEAFHACANCTGILNGHVNNVSTGVSK